jgi:3-oxoacyl-[acyl-carrier protein] reductase
MTRPTPAPPYRQSGRIRRERPLGTRGSIDHTGAILHAVSLKHTMDLNFRNKVALVTGGSRGLGRAIVLGLAAAGAKVAINYLRSPEKGIDLYAEAAELAKVVAAAHGVDALPVPGDVSKAGDVAEMYRLTESSLGPVDVLVNNAGVWPTAYVKDMTEDQWNSTMAVNLTGTFLTCREAVRRWLDSGRPGRIVNVVSQAAFHGSTTGHAHYAASKAGVVALTVSLAREVAGRGIHVNAVAPGMISTEMARDALDKNRDEYLKRIPLGRIAEPAEVANVIVFLCSERASYMTGTTVDVTGGMLMR